MKAVSVRWWRRLRWRPLFKLRGPFLVPLAEAINLTAVSFLPAELAVLLVVGGMAVGCIGGLVAAWGG